jgi:hypothetical protein
MGNATEASMPRSVRADKRRRYAVAPMVIGLLLKLLPRRGKTTSLFAVGPL